MLFKMTEITPCADQVQSFTAECTYPKTRLSLFENALLELDFKTITVGTPEVLVARRSGMLLLVAEEKLTVSHVKNKESLLKLLDTLSKTIEDTHTQMETL